MIADGRLPGRMRRGERLGLGAVMAWVGLPLAGGALFLALFAAANPLIAQALAVIRLPSVWRFLPWASVAICA